MPPEAWGLDCKKKPLTMSKLSASIRNGSVGGTAEAATVKLAKAGLPATALPVGSNTSFAASATV